MAAKKKATTQKKQTKKQLTELKEKEKQTTSEEEQTTDTYTSSEEEHKMDNPSSSENEEPENSEETERITKEIEVLLKNHADKSVLSEISSFIRTFDDIALLEFFLKFVLNYIEQTRRLAHTPYIGRKDKNPDLGDLGEHAPTLSSLKDALQYAAVPEQCEFLLGSYSYIYSRPYSWAPLYIYTTNSYREINPAIAKKDFTDTDVKTLYEIFTDVELPRLTKQFSVARCVISRPGFDVSLARSFVSYQLTSTTLDLSEGICLESEGYDYI